MKQKYLTSVSDFKTIIESKAVYVDKSRYLKAILDFDPESLDQGDDIMLFLRPRRFGKTLSVEYCARRSEESEHELVFQCSICT